MGSTCQTWWYSIRVRLSRLRARVGNNFEIVRSGGKKKNIGEKVLNNFQKGEEHSSFYFFEIKNHQTIFPICISIVYIYIHVYRDTRSFEKNYIYHKRYIYISFKNPSTSFIIYSTFPFQSTISSPSFIRHPPLTVVDPPQRILKSV